MVKNKRADLKIQETAFMLIALVLFFSLVFIFYTNVQMSNLYSERNRLFQEHAIAMLSKLTNIPELGEKNALDYDNLIAFKNTSKYDRLFEEDILKIEVIKVYPEKETITLFDRIKNSDYISYSAYSPLCYTSLDEYEQAYKKCDIAKIIVAVKQVNQIK